MRVIQGTVFLAVVLGSLYLDAKIVKPAKYCQIHLISEESQLREVFPETRGFHFFFHVENAREFREKIRNNSQESWERIHNEVSRFRKSWLRVSLNHTIWDFLGSEVYATFSGRKVIYQSVDDNNPYSIVEDPVGHYFRIRIKGIHKNDKYQYPYVDLKGRVYRKRKVKFGEFQQSTHFDYSGEVDEERLERHPMFHMDDAG